MGWNKPPYPRLNRALWTLYFAAGLALFVFADRWELAHDEGVDSLPLRSALAAFLLVAVALPPCLAWLFHRYAATIDVDVLQERPRWLSPKAAFLALFLGMATGGFALYQSARASVTDATTQRLADVVTLKEHLIDHWLDEEVEDLRSWMASPQFIALLQEWRHVGYVEGPQHAQLVEYLHQLSKSSHFVEVGARDAVSGALLLSTTGDSDGESLRDQTLAAVKARKPVLEDFHRDVDRSSENYIGFLVPVIESGQSQIREVVHVGIDPEHGLFPLLYQWQGLATSAQTLLVRVDDSELVELYESRVRANDEATARIPLSRSRYYAAGVAHSASGALRGLDNHGKSVLGFASPVRGTPWIIIAKVNLAEATAQLNVTAMLAAALAALLAMAAAWWWVEHQGYLAARVRHRLDRTQLSHRIAFLAKHTNDCIFLCDTQGRILDLNDRSLSVYGYSRAEMLGLSAADLRASDLATDLPTILQRIEMNGSALFDTVHRRRDGREFPVEISAQAIDIDGRSCIEAIVRDISERKAAEARILALSRLYATISAVNQAIVRGRDLESVFSRVCAACVDHGRFRMAWVGLVDAPGARIRPVRAAGEGSKFIDAVTAGSQPADDASDPTSVAIRDRRVCVTNDISSSGIRQEWCDTARRFGFACAIALPLARGEDTIGVLTVYGSEANGFDDASVALLREMAENLSFAIEHFEHETARHKAEAARAEHALRLTNLSRRVVQVQEEERRRLAIDLHDTAGTSLAAVQLNLMSIKNALRGSTPKASEMLAETIALIAEVIANVRDICGELRPSVLDYVGLSPALETCAKKFDERTDMTVRFTQDPAIGRLAPDLESVLYRIAQEALTNCAKHASAMRVDLRLSASDGRVTFTIIDDGSGFDLASVAQGAKAPGLGLLSMRERAEFMGGTLTVDSVPGKGTRITVELPTPDETRADSAAVSG